jgi:DNA-binding CsgD family transcriptional regulator
MDAIRPRRQVVIKSRDVSTPRSPHVRPSKPPTHAPPATAADPLKAAGLRAETQRFLHAIAVLGPGIPVDLVAGMFDAPIGRAMSMIDEAVSAGVLSCADGGVAFTSEGLRSAALSQVPRDLRAAMHRQLGAALLDRGDNPRAAARHVAAGAVAGHRPALALLDQTVRQLACHPAEAARLATLSFELTIDSSPERLPRCVAAVEALISAGGLARAVALARCELSQERRVDPWTARLHLAMSSVALLRGEPAAAAHEVACVLREADLDAQVRDNAARTQVWCALASGDRAAAAALAATMLAEEGTRASEATLATALGAFAELAWDDGRTSAALALTGAAIRRLDHQECPELLPRLRLAEMHVALGDFMEAGHVIAEAATEPLARASASGTGLALARANLALATGRIGEAVEQADSARAMSERSGTTVFRRDALCLLARVNLLLGDLRGAEECMAEHREVGTAAVEEAPVASWVSVAVAEAQDGPLAALAAARRLVEGTKTSSRLLLDLPGLAPWLTRLACAAGDMRLGKDVVDQVKRLSEANPGVPVLVAAYDHARGLLEGDIDSVTRAARVWSNPWASASGLEDAGCLHLAGGRSADARSALAEALDGYQTAQADRDSARVRARLRRLGVRRSHGTRKQRPVEGWDSLTDSEQRVVHVIAQGLTTAQAAQRLFLSPHTIDSHVRHSFRKLGVNSRVELTRIVLQHEPV